jgi:hypothetical protein
MKRLGFSSYTSGLVAATVMLAGCAGPQPPAGVTGEIPQPAALARRLDSGRSWMLPAAKSMRRLLYVSDSWSSDVYVYDYASRRLVGILSGFTTPAGQCVDRHGNIWITEFSGIQVFEYAHGGSTPIRTLTTGAQYSFGCSVDPKTGNLAVANDGNSGTIPGQVLLFKDASGVPISYQNGHCLELSSPGYDDKGNLYVEGGSYQTNDVCRLPHGGATLGLVSSNQLIYAPGSVMWDGQYITLEDNEYKGNRNTAIYQMQEATGGNLTLVGTVQLNDDCGSDEFIAQPFILGRSNTPRNRKQGYSVVGSNADCKSKVDFWSYPAGGDLVPLIMAPKEPDGQSVSVAP